MSHVYRLYCMSHVVLCAWQVPCAHRGRAGNAEERSGGRRYGEQEGGGRELSGAWDSLLGRGRVAVQQRGEVQASVHVWFRCLLQKGRECRGEASTAQKRKCEVPKYC